MGVGGFSAPLSRQPVAGETQRDPSADRSALINNGPEALIYRIAENTNTRPHNDMHRRPNCCTIHTHLTEFFDNRSQGSRANWRKLPLT